MKLIQDHLKRNILDVIEESLVIDAAAKIRLEPDELVMCDISVRIVFDPESKAMKAMFEDDPEIPESLPQ